MSHIIESQQFDREFIERLFSTADSLEEGDTSLSGKILASLFYEPSTRTRFSFEAAMHRLGGSVISTENAHEFSSAAKGETLEDSIRMTSTYVDVIVLRHPEQGASERAARVSSVPVINAGDGAGQHPTQALLDLYTIKKEVGRTDSLKIALVGDLRHGRTIRSLAYLLGRYEGIKVYFVSPEALKVGGDIKEYLDRHNVAYEELEDLVQVIGKVDVLYQTRIQKERFNDPSEYEKYKGSYQLTAALANSMKPGAIIMHPLPRVDEILPEVDELPQAVYFKQAEYGLRIRMALLKHLLG
jgi:aspartate carbamoyltransferase catalytic subunit